jgi:hypothetical protein
VSHVKIINGRAIIFTEPLYSPILDSYSFRLIDPPPSPTQPNSENSRATLLNMEDRSGTVLAIAITFSVLAWLTVGLRCYVR